MDFNKNIPSVLVLLDLIATFVTVGDEKLLNIRKSEIGIAGTAQSWFKTFLIGRTKKVKILMNTLN